MEIFSHSVLRGSTYYNHTHKITIEKIRREMYVYGGREDGSWRKRAELMSSVVKQ